MLSLDKTARFLIAKLRDRFRNTWIHRLPITGWLYTQVFKAVDTPDQISFRGINLRIDPSDTTITPTLITGQYESTELDLLASLLGEGMTVIDVGANCGVYTCLAAKSVGSTGRVVSFEPVQDNLTLLRESVELNQPATSIVDVVEAAAGPDESTVRIFLDGENSGTHSIGGTGDDYVDVRQTTIDNVVDELDLDRIDLVKVDVEGYEPGVLAGADRSLQRFSPMLLCEFDAEMIRSTGGDPNDFASCLSAYGNVFEIDERSGDMVAIAASDVAMLHNSNLIVMPER